MGCGGFSAGEDRQAALEDLEQGLGWDLGPEGGFRVSEGSQEPL